MRNLLTALILASCAALAACGGSDGGDGGSGGGNDGGTGGSGGTGGTGGSGGTGGTGGTGGSTDKTCGNKTVDAGEECDDGNPFDGDGCSSLCTVEDGTCNEPRDYLFVSRPGQENVIGHAGSLAGPGSVNTCGVGDGADLTYIYTAPFDGRLLIQLASESSTFLSVSTTCGDSSSEIFCETTGALKEVEVAKNDVLYFVVDTPATAQAIDYTLVTRLVPIFGEGERCPADDADPEIHGACADHLICTQVEAQRICVEPNVPAITGADAYRIGQDLQLIVDGADDDRDVAGVLVKLLDSSGTAIPLTGIEPGTITQVQIPFDVSMQGHKSFLNATATASGFFTTSPEAEAATRVEVVLYDSRDRTSEMLIVPLVVE